MQKIVIVANGAPYGSESLFNSLRLAICVTAGGNLDLRLFLMSDARFTAGLRAKPEGYNIQQMLGSLPLKSCR